MCLWVVQKTNVFTKTIPSKKSKLYISHLIHTVNKRAPNVLAPIKGDTNSLLLAPNSNMNIYVNINGSDFIFVVVRQEICACVYIVIKSQYLSMRTNVAEVRCNIQHAYSTLPSPPGARRLEALSQLSTLRPHSPRSTNLLPHASVYTRHIVGEGDWRHCHLSFRQSESYFLFSLSSTCGMCASKRTDMLPETYVYSNLQRAVSFQPVTVGCHISLKPLGGCAEARTISVQCRINSS